MRLLRRVKGQSTLEYAMFVAVIAAAVASMGIYVRRSVQAKLKGIEEKVNGEALK